MDDNTHNALDELYHNEDDTQSPFWSRVYSDLEDYDETCDKTFLDTIKHLNTKNNRNRNNEIKGMILGHSPQYLYGRGINSACNNKIWRVDVGMSRAFGALEKGTNEYNNRKAQVLVITNDKDFNIVSER